MLLSGGTWGTNAKKKPWCNPLGKVEDGFRCSASAVSITKLGAPWEITRVQTWAGAEWAHSGCGSAETVRSSRVGWRNYQYEGSTWPVLFSDQWQWVTVAHPPPWRAAALWTTLKNLMCVNAATYTDACTVAECIRKCVWRKCTC